MTAAEYDRVPRVLTADYNSPAAASLEAIWATKPGVYGWISTVDHKEIGVRYLVHRLRLSDPRRPGGARDPPAARPSGPGTGHAGAVRRAVFRCTRITMIFLYAQPVLSGFSNYLFPLVLGARDMAFPRLNAFSYWIYLAAGIFMYASLFAGGRAEQRLVQLRALCAERVQPGSEYRLLCAWHDLPWNFYDGRRR